MAAAAGSSRKLTLSKPAAAAASRRISMACSERSSDHRAAHRRAELSAGGQAYVFDDVRGDMHDDLAHLRIEPVTEHRLRRFDQVAAAAFQITLHRRLAEQRVLKAGDRGGGVARALFHPLPAHHAQRFAAQLVLAARRPSLRRQREIAGVGHQLGEKNRRSKLLRVAEAHERELAVDERGGGRIAGAEIDTDVHGSR
jgi:hypothetical protein